MDIDWLLDEFDEIVYVSDVENYNLLYINNKCAEIVGVKDRSSLIGQKCYGVLQGFKEPCHFCTNHLLSKDKFYQWDFNNCKLNKHFVLKDRLVDWKGRKARIEFAVDVTRFRTAIDKVESEMKTILESIPGGVCRIDADDCATILWHNRKFLDLIGYTKEQFEVELGGKVNYIDEEYAPYALKMMQQIKVSKAPIVFEMKIRCRDGSSRMLLTTLSYDSSQAKPYFYSIGIDITYYRQDEKRSKDAVKEMLKAAREANSAKGAFLSRMSHEIRTPLNAVIGMSAIAANNIDDKYRVIDCHNKITTAANYLLSLINDILDISKIDSGKMVLMEEPFSFNDVVSEIIMLFTMQMEEKGINFVHNIEELEEDSLIGDKMRIKQVIINLLSNAAKFTPKKGQVDFTAKKINSVNDKLLLQFAVQDTGVGMSKEFINKAFNMFEQSSSSTAVKYGGSGLGLTICKYISDLMDGSIDIESEEGVGSRFTFTIPVKINCEHQQDLKSIDRHWEECDFSKIHALIAEDNEINAEVICAVLEMKGITTTVVSDGTKAVDAFINSPHNHFDVILMDIRMPEMDGLTATRLIRNSGRSDSQTTPIIALSANAFDEDRRISIDNGMNEHISKPINNAEMFTVLAKLLNLNTANPL